MSTGARLRVLLVDDASDVRLMVRMLLSDRPELHVVAEACDGQQAVDLAAALQPDLIVLDVAMPVLDGLSALPRLRQVSPNSRIVMLSALPRGLQEPAALRAGAAAYVEKTAHTDTLVDDLLAGARLLDVAVEALSVQATENFAAEPRSVSAARRFAVGTLKQWDQDDLADIITLLLSELVTNAILHADSAPDVTVRLLPDRVHVQVTDSHPGSVGLPDIDEESTHGRGLALVETLARDWGSVDLSGGKVVWFDVARA